MTRQLLANTFDAKTIAAVDYLAAEDADAVLAVWFRMLALAVHDPEGSVRLTPGLQMDTEALAGYFHCTTEAVEATVQVMEQLQLLARDETGNLWIPACAGPARGRKTKKSSDANLFSGEKETEKEKRKEAKEKSKEKNKKGDIAAAISESPACAGAAAAADGIQHNKPQDGSAPFHPCKTRNRMIPLAELPEPARNILKAWNGLPLDNKFEGLYPTLLKQMQAMLERYGEEAILKAVANVAESSFLLGRSRNNRGWAISLGWMLNPDHLAYAGFSNGGVTGDHQILFYSQDQATRDYFPDYQPDEADAFSGKSNAYLCVYGARHMGTEYPEENVSYPPTFFAIGRHDFVCCDNLFKEHLPYLQRHEVPYEIHTFAAHPHGYAGWKIIDGNNDPNFDLWVNHAVCFLEDAFDICRWQKPEI